MTKEEFEAYVNGNGYSIVGPCWELVNQRWYCNLVNCNAFADYKVFTIAVDNSRKRDPSKIYDELKLEFDKMLEEEDRKQRNLEFQDWLNKETTDYLNNSFAENCGDDSMFCDCDEDAEVDGDKKVVVDMENAYGRDWYEESEKIYENVKWHALRDLEWIMQNKREYCIPYIACRSALTAKEIDDILLEEEPLALDAVVQIAHAMGHRVEINFVKEDGVEDGNE